MCTFFLSFVLRDNIIIKLFGIVFASAIFIDATLIRMVVVPSTMALLGDANWWLPKWLDRILPHLDIEGSSVESPVPAGAGVGAGAGDGHPLRHPLHAHSAWGSLTDDEVELAHMLGRG